MTSGSINKRRQHWPTKPRSLRESGQLDFARDVEPWIVAEAAVTFCLTHITNGPHPAQAPSFLGEVVDPPPSADPERFVYDVAERYGVHHQLSRLESMARPFAGVQFTSRTQWTNTVEAFIEADLEHASRGNVTDPLKAALDTFRDLRPSIRAAVDFGGLTPSSHDGDFLTRFVPAYSLLVAGPPNRRNEEILALLRSGIVSIAGPSAAISENNHGNLLVHSPAVPGVQPVQRVIDARIPRYEAGRCRSVLYPQLLADGLVRRYRHVGEEQSIETGACETDPNTAQAISHDGTPTDGLFLIGIPTERLRWFTQIGNGRPEVFGGFTADADRVAVHSIEHIRRTRLTTQMSGAQI